MADKYLSLSRKGKLHGTVARARRLRHERDRCQTEIMLHDDRQKRVLIPPGNMTRYFVESDVRVRYPHRRRWIAVRGVTDETVSRAEVITVVANHGPGNRYASMNYEPRIRSFGVITRLRLCWYIGSQHAIWVAKHGWHFGSCVIQSSEGKQRLYVCKNAYEHNANYRFYFNSDDIICDTRIFWGRAADHVLAVKAYLRRKKEDCRITSTVVTASIVVPHNGVRTVLRVQRTGPMRYTHAVKPTGIEVPV